MMLWAVLESFGYRQLMTFWRLRGLAKYLRGNKEWGVMTRGGFAEAETEGEAGANLPEPVPRL
jgi:hypothetical protein